MSPIDDILHRYMSGNNNNGELTAQNVSLYHDSPYTIYCGRFVNRDVSLAWQVGPKSDFL